MNVHDAPDVITPAALARLAGVTRRTVHRWVAAGWITRGPWVRDTFFEWVRETRPTRGRLRSLTEVLTRE